MDAASRLALSVTAGAVLLASACHPGNSDQGFAGVVRRAQKVVLHEGLPHRTYGSQLLEKERRTKEVEDVGGHPFYKDLLELSGDDAKEVSDILGDPGTYKPFSGEKKCGGFHPDYAAEWQVGADRYWALICFGCYEVKLLGPGFNSRLDLNQVAYERRRQVLKAHQKNRPAPKTRA
jgi:hypothetical protein